MAVFEQYRKAVAALVVPALVIIIAALMDGSDGGSSITMAEWLTALVASLTASGAVASVTNTTTNPAVAARQSVVLKGTRARDLGLSTAATAALVALVVVLVVLFVLPRL